MRIRMFKNVGKLKSTFGNWTIGNPEFVNSKLGKSKCSEAREPRIFLESGGTNEAGQGEPLLYFPLLVSS